MSSKKARIVLLFDILNFKNPVAPGVINDTSTFFQPSIIGLVETKLVDIDVLPSNNVIPTLLGAALQAKELSVAIQ